MKKKLFPVFIVIFFYCSVSFPQVSVSVDSLSWGQVLTNTSNSMNLKIKNMSGLPDTFAISNINNVFTMSDTLVFLDPNDSTEITVTYHPVQNVVYNDILEMKGRENSNGLYLNLSGSALYGDSYDAGTFNKYDAQLKNALTTLVFGHTSLGYNLARDKMFMEIDNKKVNGQGAPVNTLECVYTGREAVGYTDRTNAQNNYNFNTEHTWPQSNFNEDEPMRSDLFHLYPTDANANNVRANYPFGNVVSNVTWDSAGSRLGRNSLNQIVFEPRDIHKGDVSRSMFYFLIRYPQNYGSFFTQVQENVFRGWNELDSVGTIESARNTAIASFQMKRNPFIDHPEFANRIYSFVTNTPRPLFTELKVLPLEVNFDSTLVGDSTSQFIYIANKGNGILNLDSIVLSDDHFSISYNFDEINPYSSVKVPVLFKPDSLTSYSGILKVYAGIQTFEINLTGTGKDNSVGINEPIYFSSEFELEQNYPNPFNPETKIRFSINSNRSNSQVFVTLKIFDVLGKEITTLVNESKSPGVYEINFPDENLKNSLPTGIYFYQLTTAENIKTKKMMLLK
ncbi:MAG: endonuclease [Ignavibacteriales bacterium]|nr:MAG: endonuclease [Ignavibacteriales bacterium]